MAQWLRQYVETQRTQFSSQYPQGSSQPSLTLVARDPTPSSDPSGTRLAHGAHRYT